MFWVTMSPGAKPVRITTAADLQRLLRDIVAMAQVAAMMSAPESNPDDIKVVGYSR